MRLFLFSDMYKMNTVFALHNASTANLDDLIESIEMSGAASVDMYNGNFSLLLEIAPHMAALNVNVFDVPELSITTIYNDTAQHSLPIIMNIISNAYYKYVMHC